MRIYTKTGDKGKTSLGNGDRIQKSSTIIEALGNIDELNCFIGLFLSHEKPNLEQEIIDFFIHIQNDLFNLGADLCMIQSDGFKFSYFSNHEKRTHALEAKIDFYEALLPPLKTFILPGGTPQSSHIHCIRSITRRAERKICNLCTDHKDIHLSPAISYLNRLSDFLFVLARFFNNKGQNDIQWVKHEENS
jgi:cob(I)alamin adenosyltransferase